MHQHVDTIITGLRDQLAAEPDRHPSRRIAPSAVSKVMLSKMLYDYERYNDCEIESRMISQLVCPRDFPASRGELKNPRFCALLDHVYDIWSEHGVM